MSIYYEDEWYDDSDYDDVDDWDGDYDPDSGIDYEEWEAYQLGLDEQEAQWNANRAADMFGPDGEDDGNPYVELM